MTIRIKSHTVAVAIRTAVQALAGGGLTAAGLAALAQYGTHLPVGWAAAAAVGLTWLASIAHNALEDHGIIGTWLRQDTLTPATVAKETAKAQAAADKQTAALAAQAAAAAPAAAPLIDELKAYVDQAVAGLAQQIPALLAQATPAAVPPPPVPVDPGTGLPATPGP